ncbi:MULTISPECIES: helix-turn-helix transcriptional regulator [unclassified Sedimentibacter]|uniref:helix-turn-helix transcriptional regulator n=1 Tax=unclassified Sedimentibacter TaxID=2649220 RepID=UPI0027E0083A|nr:YafY family protein [Sedimentibacter sp. MB35-C1]WMJ75936.1 YafY family protein [Sedimentibacter sp. MB35-C1]
MQINRLFEIIYILLQKQTVTAKELALRFEVSPRTIYRDVESLSSAGIPIYMSRGKGGGISLLPDFVLDKAVMTDEEKEKILSSLRAVGAVDLSEENKALQKFISLFGEAYADWIEVDFSSWYNCDGETKTFQTLKTCVLKKKIVSFQYSNTKGEQILRTVEPLKLCFKGGAWYLFGYCKTRMDFRFFKLRRIKNLEIRGEAVEHTAPRHVKAETDYNEEFVSLKLHLAAEMAFRVYEEFSQYEKQEDGSFICKIDYPRGEWLFYYILSFGKNCEVLEPEDIRVEIKLLLKKMINFYI